MCADDTICEDNPLSAGSLTMHRTHHDPATELLTLEREIMAEQQHTGNPGNFAEDREKASRAGHTGGQHSSGNFANDRERAAEAGRKGGQSSHGSASSHESSAADHGAEHRPGNFAEDREKASAAGKKGGQSSHRG
jgi:general stress protein YciG